MASSFITGVATGDMGRTLANDRIVVMAEHTFIHNGRVIKVSRDPGRSAMAVLTGIRADNMPHVLTNDWGVIVAADAGSGEE